ncbi:hypothetical protein [Kutzneria sp. NPDC052558]|uniref:hypothetical protein n=1 Tax=Kutzneria sp. NPDC052558 TaxID=3364121 RepID=UPI0037C8A159
MFAGKIDTVKQAGHIRNTTEFLNRLKTRNGENSRFLFGNRWANFHTRLGNALGKANPKSPHIRMLRLPYPVGRSRFGPLQRVVRVSNGKKGMHGSPWYK